MKAKIERNNPYILQVIVVHRHGDRTPISAHAGLFKQSEDLVEFWKSRLPARHRLSAWGAVDDEPTETYLSSKAPMSSSPPWPNGLSVYIFNDMTRSWPHPLIDGPFSRQPARKHSHRTVQNPDPEQPAQRRGAGPVLLRGPVLPCGACPEPRRRPPQGISRSSALRSCGGSAPPAHTPTHTLDPPRPRHPPPA